MKERIEALLAEVENLKLRTAQEIEDARVRLLGKKGEITALFDEFRNVDKDRKREFGQQLNRLKTLAAAKIEELKSAAEAAGQSSAPSEDLSAPGDSYPLGSRHPVSICREEIVRIFRKFGYDVAEGPEVEDDWHVFEALNFPPEHPAREMQDTFFVTDNSQKNPVLLRTHTSCVQVRCMETMKLPIRVVCPGRVFRNEAISARAHCIFHQVEGLYIDENVTFADMKQAILLFAREMFGPETQIRMRPSYFPFTEPSAEMEIGNMEKLHGHTFPLCLYSPGVIPIFCLKIRRKYSGFAFGMGVERIAMLKWQVKDLRNYFENDLRFLKEFESNI